MAYSYIQLYSFSWFEPSHCLVTPVCQRSLHTLHSHHTRTHTHIHIHTLTHTRTHTRTDTHTHMHTYPHTGIWHLEYFSPFFVSWNFAIHAHSHAHTRTHTHAHIHTNPDPDDKTSLTSQNVGKVYYRLLHWNCSFDLLYSADLDILGGPRMSPSSNWSNFGHTVSNLYF